MFYKILIIFSDIDTILAIVMKNGVHFDYFFLPVLKAIQWWQKNGLLRVENTFHDVWLPNKI